MLQILKQLLIESTFLDELLQDFRVHDLRTAEVHNLVENFIDEREVFFNMFLVKLSSEVSLTNKNKLV